MDDASTPKPDGARRHEFEAQAPPDPPPPFLVTDRLELIACNRTIARATAFDRAELAAMLHVCVPSEWPPEIMGDGFQFLVTELERDPGACGWWFWHVILASERLLIGGVGLKGRPKKDGRVDIGFATIDPLQRRGYAFEATQALLRWAFTDQRVNYVVGETFDHLTPSIRLMEKLGFQYFDRTTGHEGEDGVLQYRLTRKRYEDMAR